MRKSLRSGWKKFLSTPSARRATFSIESLFTAILISIHALREEGDLHVASARAVPGYFYPRPPRGGRPIKFDSTNFTGSFLSTPSARRATVGIAIFPPKLTLFLSTPSARRATVSARLRQVSITISIHALREEGDFIPSEVEYTHFGISIHALREEGDGVTHQLLSYLVRFLSTPSARRATPLEEEDARRWAISIHALREEGDDIPRVAGLA